LVRLSRHIMQKTGVETGRYLRGIGYALYCKKFEVKRPEFFEGKVPYVDAVVTTRELARMIKLAGIDFRIIDDSTYDSFFDVSSGAGKIFGSTGGVMEAAVRTAYNMITGKDMDKLEFEPVRGLKGIKEAEVDIRRS
jgi:iron only hydrogenase large subunit-like protein